MIHAAQWTVLMLLMRHKQCIFGRCISSWAEIHARHAVNQDYIDCDGHVTFSPPTYLRNRKYWILCRISLFAHEVIRLVATYVVDTRKLFQDTYGEGANSESFDKAIWTTLICLYFQILLITVAGSTIITRLYVRVRKFSAAIVLCCSNSKGSNQALTIKYSTSETQRNFVLCR
jgi:hypothetical protein